MTKTFQQFLKESEASTNMTGDGSDTSNIVKRGSRMDLGKDGSGSENHIAKRKPIVESDEEVDGDREDDEPYTMDQKLERLKKRRNS